MTASCKHFTTALALWVIAWAQVFGIQKGYLCECTGVHRVTQEDHCHTSHSAVDQDHEETFPCESSDHSHEDGDTEKHAAIIENWTALEATALQVASTEWIVLHTQLVEWIFTALQPRAVNLAATSPRWEKYSRGRTWPEMLAHQIVLRV
jgi:hypothetical protein